MLQKPETMTKHDRNDDARAACLYLTHCVVIPVSSLGAHVFYLRPHDETSKAGPSDFPVASR